MDEWLAIGAAVLMVGTVCSILALLRQRYGNPEKADQQAMLGAALAGLGTAIGFISLIEGHTALFFIVFVLAGLGVWLLVHFS